MKTHANEKFFFNTGNYTVHKNTKFDSGIRFEDVTNLTIEDCGSFYKSNKIATILEHFPNCKKLICKYDADGVMI